MSKPLATLDPSTRNVVEKNRRLTRAVDEPDPSPPKYREAFGLQDSVKSIPANGVKGFPKVEFENHSRS